MILTLLLFNMFHPLYVSFTKVDYNVKTQTIQISSRIFFEDLNNAVNQESKTKFDITKSSDKKNQALVTNYLKKHLKVTINGQTLLASYLGYEIQGDVAWYYQEIKHISKVQKVSVFNNMLYQLHADQINLVELNINEESKTLKFQIPTTLIDTSL